MGSWTVIAAGGAAARAPAEKVRRESVAASEPRRRRPCIEQDSYHGAGRASNGVGRRAPGMVESAPERFAMIANPFSSSIRMKDGFPVLPGALPFVGHLVQLGTGRDLAAILAEAREKLGPLFWVDFGLHYWTLF